MRRYNGWVRKWGKRWRVECTGSSQESVSADLAREFGIVPNTSTLVLRDGETPYLHIEPDDEK